MFRRLTFTGLAGPVVPAKVALPFRFATTLKFRTCAIFNG